MNTPSATSAPAKMPVKDMHLGPRHLWVVFVASLGQLIGTAVATLAGVIIPMINILRHPELSTFMQGLIGAADLVGIMVGSVIFGRLIDRYGYLLFFRLCPMLILISSLVSIFFPSVAVLVVCLFFVGVGIGGEYSLDSGYISELLPEKYTSFMIGLAKSASALGNIIAAALAFLLITDWHSAVRWPDLMWIVAAIAAVMVVTRIWFWESPKWLADKGEMAAADKAARHFLGPEAEVLPPAAPATAAKTAPKSSYLSFIKDNFNKVMLSGVPWACEGLGVYGFGVFLPILIIALGIEHVGAEGNNIMHVASSVKVTFWISCIILPGFIIGLLMIRRKRNVCKMQTLGFWMCAVAMIVLLIAYWLKLDKWVSIISFMVFELFLNFGPHLVTYVLPPKIYPVSDRGRGSGLAAGIGKLGAVLGVFLIPILLGWGGPLLVLGVSAAVMALGAIVTAAYAPKVR